MLKMFFLLLIFSCLSLNWASVPILMDDYDSEFDLTWSEVYSVKAVKMSLTSGLTENMVAWYDGVNMKSRVDYNGGVVKKITFDNDTNEMYEIHPETTEEELNKIVCIKQEGFFDNYDLEDILPDTEGLDEIGVEIIDNMTVTKFFYKDLDETSDKRKILWAYYDDYFEIWIPVRYEVFEYNSWLGSLSEHVYWEFYDYNTTVDDEVFNITEHYDCQSSDDYEIENQLRFLNPENHAHVNHTFNAFKKKYNRIYAHANEHEMRKKIFQNNLRLVASRNRQNLGYKLTINQFSDRTKEEMRKHKGLKRRPEGEIGTIPFPYTKEQIDQSAKLLPEVYDARLEGLVAPVRNQETCGSCWAFSTTAVVEAAVTKSNGGRLITLSEQAILDCSWGFGGTGCDGGTDVESFKWIMKYGLPTEEEYGQYTNQDGYCRIHNVTDTYKIRGFTDVTPFSAEALKVALVNHGPLSVSVEASDAFVAYSSGIFYDPTCSQYSLNHEVTVVGYGERDGDLFWIIRNSWGPQWGVDGYIYISARNNNCGVLTEPTYVVM